MVWFDRALAVQPELAEAFNNRGTALAGLRRFADAVLSYDRALALQPGVAEVLVNRGNAFLQMLDLSAALWDFEQAIVFNPEYSTAFWCKAVLKILLGDYLEGWRLFEWRWRDEQKQQLRVFSQPLWLGAECVAGKTVLVYPEQGLGDFIQFCRYVVLLVGAGARVVLEAPLALHALLESLPVEFCLLKVGDVVPVFDLQCPIMSLPLAFGTTLESIPAAVPYLAAEPGRQAFWQGRLGEKSALRVGLVWSGSAAHRNDFNRSIPLALFAPLLRLPFEFHAVQKEFRPEDAALLAELGNVHTHAACLGDFADTAALLSELDLVICVDTSVAHLAGAMGRPLWVLLPFLPDYRWLLGREDCPWYPTARLFRQPAFGDWASVVARVVEDLQRV